MVLKLYGRATATCTLRVAVVLYEKQIPYEFHAIDLFKGEQKTPEYLEKQPFGQIPYIDDDGFILYESRAIGRYLSAKYADKGPKLIPDVGDLKAYALYEQAASVESFNFDPFASKAIYENVLKKLYGGIPDVQLFNSLIEALGAKLEAYEVILGKQKYLAGDEITLADLFHLPFGMMLSVAGSDIMLKQGPNVTRWWNDLTSRPAWKAVAQGIPEKPAFSLDQV
ncbi:glutathione s-transferase [Moniliophthora roreri]|uniref:glutathione transferase n=1 Tax=Moniliophthora roreri TaxID=221103 RepID=A0A0W0G4J1_MONRR|nr:glutathione s-transferase [Moniliophthora roreri]